MKITKTQTLVECAILVAIATALSFVKIFHMPLGGSITLCSMAPLAVISFRHGARWGLISAFVHGSIQMMLGMENVMYCQTFLTMLGCILLDYILAFAVIGLACLFASPIKSRYVGIAFGTVIVGLLRLFCSFLSGILIWGSYAPEGTPVWLYSLTYNGSFLVPEIVLMAIATVAIMKIADTKFPVGNEK